MGTDINVVIARPINGEEVYGNPMFTAEMVCHLKCISRNYEFFSQLAGVRYTPTSPDGQIIKPVVNKITQCGWPKCFGFEHPSDYGAEHTLLHCSPAEWRLACNRSAAHGRPICPMTQLVSDIADAVEERFGAEAIICFGFDS